MPEDVKKPPQQRAAGDPERDQRGRTTSDFLGRQVEVLVEGPSKAAVRRHDDDHDHGPVQLVGRTMCDRIVVFDGNPRQVGQILPVSIYDANAHTLFGAVVTQHVGPELYALERRDGSLARRLRSSASATRSATPVELPALPSARVHAAMNRAVATDASPRRTDRRQRLALGDGDRSVSRLASL